MRGFYMDEPFTGSPSDLEHISHDTNFTAKQWVDNTSASIAPIEATSTASQPYTIGKRLVYGGRLYKVTQAIAQGGTLTPGTNIITDTVDDELSAINTHLTANNNPFRFGYDATEDAYGYIVPIGGADTFFPFKSDRFEYECAAVCSGTGGRIWNGTSAGGLNAPPAGYTYNFSTKVLGSTSPITGYTFNCINGIITPFENVQSFVLPEYGSAVWNVD